MCRFVETIQLLDGEPQNLACHNARLNETRRMCLGMTDEWDLGRYVQPCLEFRKGVVRCRVVYGRAVQEVTYAPYVMRPVRTLRLVACDTVDYSYKRTDRRCLEELHALKEGYDDVLIVKNGRLTDTTIANVALEQDGVWYTPSVPLLKGTRRTRLLELGCIKERDILADEIKAYSRMALFNAMIGFKELVVDIRPGIIGGCR